MHKDPWHRREGLALVTDYVCSIAAQRSVQGSRCPAGGLTEWHRSICAGGSPGTHPSSTHRARPYQQVKYRLVDGTSPNSPLFVTILLTISSGYVDFPHLLPKPERPSELKYCHTCTKGYCSADVSPSHCAHPEITLQPIKDRLALSEWSCLPGSVEDFC